MNVRLNRVKSFCQTSKSLNRLIPLCKNLSTSFKERNCLNVDMFKTFNLELVLKRHPETKS